MLISIILRGEWKQAGNIHNKFFRGLENKMQKSWRILAIKRNFQYESNDSDDELMKKS